MSKVLHALKKDDYKEVCKLRLFFIIYVPDLQSKQGNLYQIYFYIFILQFCSVQSLSHVWLFKTPWTTTRQASLYITNRRSPLKPVSIELVMPFNYLILSSPSPPALTLSQHQGLFQLVSSLDQVAKVLEFQL